MSEYLPSFIVEPVLRQARRFSERIGGEDSPVGALGSTFTLPTVPDLQRFYPSRFWTLSPSQAAAAAVTAREEVEAGVAEAPLEHGHVAEESTLRSIARNIQLWANQINNLDMDDDVLQEPEVLPSIEQHIGASTDTGAVLSDNTLTEEPDVVASDHHSSNIRPSLGIQASASRSLPAIDQLRQPQRTSSETSLNPAHELSYRSRYLEQNSQGRSQSDPFAAVDVPETLRSRTRDNNPMHEDGQVAEENVYNRPRDGSGALPEDDGMKPLRAKINNIWAGSGTAAEKSRSVHALMTERYRLSQNAATPTSSATATSPPFSATSPISLASMRSDELPLSVSSVDLQPTYAPLDGNEGPDEITGEMPKPDLGCLHYKRNVKMQCATCERWYTCRICHDEKEDHQLPRRDTKHMLCMICSTPQPVGQVCKACHVQAACYYCPICKLWNNDANKSIYHCDDCGICRLGKGLGKDFFHCKTCAACMSISAESTHRCIEKSTKCDCPICGEFMFTSSLPVTFMRCGHSIHDSCFEEWCNTSYKCPICSKSIANMESQFRRLDRHIEEQPMPEEYNHNRAYIFCNDCNSRSVVKYHWLGLKCGVCDSYNTAQLELLGPESAAIQARADRAQEMGVGEAAITASQTQTPTEDVSSLSRRLSYVAGGATAPVHFETQPEPNIGTPRSAMAVPVRRGSPFHNLPHSPTRSLRAVSPVVGSYFGTGQRPPPAENRRGSYFSVLNFGSTTAEDTNQANAAVPLPPFNPANSDRSALRSTISASSHTRQQSYTSSSHLSPPTNPSRLVAMDIPEPGSTQRGTASLDDNDDDDMDFWGGHSPRNHDADIVDLDLDSARKGKTDEEEESSSDEEEDEMDFDDDEEDEDEDPMDILIGHW